MDTIKQLELNINEIQKITFKIATPKNIALAAASFGLTYLGYRTLVIYFRRRKYRHIPGPSTKGIYGYYFGNVHEILEAVKNGKIMADLLVEWHGKYGEVFKYQMKDEIIVVTSDKNAIRDTFILKNFPKPEKSMQMVKFPFGTRFLGHGLVTDTDYERWRNRRAIFNPGFHRHVLVTFVGHFNEIVNTLSEILRRSADDKTVIHLFNEINRATLDAIALIAFGMHTESVSVKDSILNMYLTKILKILDDFFLDPLWKYKPSKQAEIKELKHMLQYIRKMGKDKIVERITAFKNNEHMPDDILSAILTSFKGEDLDLEFMADDFVTFFIAGQETTANTLAFCFLEMCKNPEIVKKAREEIDRVLGKRTEITFQDVAELKYCLAIFKEALRLFPPVTVLQRITKEVLHVNNYEIPSNTPLNVSTYMNARYEKYFKSAYEFKPERFLKNSDGEYEKENYVYLPFSLGPRNCIGQNFAQLEGVIVIAKLLQKFDMRLDPTQSFDIETKLTLRPKDGTRVFMTIRS